MSRRGYVCDLLSLRRVPVHIFGILASVHPVLAALAGWLMLHQELDITAWAGSGLIVCSNILISMNPYLPSRMCRGRGR